MPTTTTNQGLILPADSDLNDVATAFASYNAGVERRLVMRFLNATDRSARFPSPVEGDLSYLAAEDRYEWYTGSAWATIFFPGQWTTYTPTWGVTGGTSSTIGNGTLLGRYQQTGQTVHFIAQITMGSTTTYSATQWTLSLPVTARVTSTMIPIFNGRIADATPGSAWGAQAAVEPSGNTVSLEAQGTTNVEGMRQGFPITFAVNDVVTIQGTYEAQ